MIQCRARPVLLLALLAACPARAQAPAVREAYVPVLIDGSLSGAALVRGGVAYLPLRSVARALKLDVSYNADAQLILIRTPGAARVPGLKPAPVE